MFKLIIMWGLMVFYLMCEKKQIHTNLFTFWQFALIKGKIYSLLMPLSSKCVLVKGWLFMMYGWFWLSHFGSQMHVVQFEGLAILDPMYDILSKGTPNFPIPNEHIILGFLSKSELFPNTPRSSAWPNCSLLAQTMARS